MNVSLLWTEHKGTPKENLGSERIYTMSKIFIDTNIFIYSMDRHAPEKRQVCRQLLKRIVSDFTGVISTQVMQEFYVAATKKLKADPLLVKDILHAMEKLIVVVITPQIIKEAIDCGIIARISFWDALIVVAAESAQCEKLWSEDLNDGQIIRGVKIENPLILSQGTP
jgi:predicted nucleic acid-binding protein